MSTGEIIVLSLIVWNVIGAFILIPITLKDDCRGFTYTYIEIDALNPIYIYQHTSCNIFGTILLTILVNLLCPIVTICYWVYKLCTVGRK